ncbi:hypothetical protein Trydic_g71 [Trypoxylus dichotomus]
MTTTIQNTGVNFAPSGKSSLALSYLMGHRISQASRKKSVHFEAADTTNSFHLEVFAEGIRSQLKMPGNYQCQAWQDSLLMERRGGKEDDDRSMNGVVDDENENHGDDCRLS